MSSRVEFELAIRKSAFSDGMQEAMQEIEEFESGISGLEKGMGGINSVFEDAGAGASTMAEAFAEAGGAAEELGDLIETAMGRVSDSVAGAVDVLSGLGGAGADAAGETVDAFDDLEGGVSQAIDTAIDKAEEFGGALEVMPEAAGKVVGDIEGELGGIEGAVSVAVEAAEEGADQFQGALEVMPEAAGQVSKDIEGELGDVQNIVEQATDVSGAVAAFESQTGGFVDASVAATEGSTQAFETLPEGVGGAVAGVQAEVTTYQDIVSGMGGATTEATGEVISAVQNMESDVTSSMQSATQEVEGFSGAISTVATDAIDPIQQMGQSFQEATAQVTDGAGQAGDALTHYHENLEQTGESAGLAQRAQGGFNTSIGLASSSISNAASAAWGLYNAYDSMEEKELAAARSANMVEKAQYAATNAQMALEKTRTKAGVSAEQLAQAEEKVRLAQEKLALVTERNEIVQGNLTEAWGEFYTNVGPMVVQVVGNVIGAFAGLSQSWGGIMKGLGSVKGAFGNFVAGLMGSTTAAQRQAAANHLAATSATPLAAANQRVGTSAISSATSLNVATGAAVRFGAAMRGAGIAALQFIRHPIGMIMVGMGAAMALVSTNAFGLQDHITGAGKAIGDLFPAMKPVLEGLKELGMAFGMVPQKAEAMGIAVDGSEVALKDLDQANKDITDSNLAVIETEVDLANVTTSSGTAVAAAAQSIKDKEKATQDEVNANFKLVESVHGTAAALGLSEQQLQANADALRMNAEAGTEVTTAIDDLREGYFKVGSTLGPLLQQMGVEVDLSQINAQAGWETARSKAALAEAYGNEIENTTGATDKLREHVATQLISQEKHQEAAHAVTLEGDALVQYAAAHGISTDAKEMEKAATDEYVEALQKEIDELGLSVTATTENVTQVAELTRAHKLQQDIIRQSTEASRGYKEEALSGLAVNIKTAEILRLQGDAYNETAVIQQGYADGLKEYNNRLAETHGSIVQQATALGYVGDKTKESIAAMSIHISETRSLKDASDAAGQSWTELSDAGRDQLETMGLSEEVMNQVIAGTLTLGEAHVQMIQDVSDEEAARLAYIDTLQAEIDAKGILMQVTEDNTQVAEAEIAAKERQIAVSARVAEIMKGVGLESQGTAEASQRVIDNVWGVVGALDMEEVRLDAVAKGRWAYANTAVEEVHSLIERAEAIGINTDALENNMVGIFKYIPLAEGAARATAAQQTAFDNAVPAIYSATIALEEEIGMNKEAAATWSQLSESSKAALRQYGLTDEAMTRVILTGQGLTEQGRWMIDVQAELDRTTVASVSSMAELEAATGGVGKSFGQTEEQIRFMMQRLAESNDITGVTRDQHADHLNTMMDLNPQIQKVAYSWGIYTDSTLGANAEGQRMIEKLQDMSSAMDTNEDTVRDLAETYGLDMHESFKMSHEDIIAWLADADNLNEKQMSVAEKAEEASQAFAEKWGQNLDDITQKMSEWNSHMNSQANSMFDEMGAEVERHGDDFKTKFKAGFGFTEQFMKELFPQELIAWTLDDSLNFDDIITKLRGDVELALSNGLITEQMAEESMYPLIDWAENGLPEQFAGSIDYLAGALPGQIERLTPVLLNGVTQVGADAKDAIRTGIAEPLIEDLKGLMHGDSGAEVTANWQKGLDGMLSSLGEKHPEVEEAIRGMMSTAGPTMEEQANAMIAAIEQIDPALAQTIKDIDTDSDGISDIYDTNIVDPTRAMVDAAILEYRELLMFQGKWSKDMETKFQHDVPNAMDLLKSGTATGFDEAKHAANVGQQGVVDEVGGVKTGIEQQVPLVEQAIMELEVGFKELIAFINGPQGLGSINYRLIYDRLVEQQEPVRTALTSVGGAFTQLRDFANGQLGLSGINFGIVPYMLSQATPNIIAAMQALGATFTETRDYINGEYGLAGINFGVIATSLTNSMPTIMAGLGTLDTNIQGWMNGMSTGLGMFNFTPFNTAWNTEATSGIMPSLGALGTTITTWMAGMSTGMGMMDFTPMHTAFNTAMDTLYNNLNTKTTNLSTLWVTHGQSVLANINVINGYFATYLAHLDTLYGNLDGKTTNLSTLYVTHGQSILASINILNGHFRTYEGYMDTLYNNLNTKTTNTSALWVTHGSSLLSSVNIIKGHLDDYDTHASQIEQGIKADTENMGAHFERMRDRIGDAADRIEDHVRGMAGVWHNNLDAMQRDATATIGKVDDMREAINRLQNKTITIHTNYTSSGTPAVGGRQHGFEGIVTQPTRFLVGENHQPELVIVEPLNSSKSINSEAASRMAQNYAAATGFFGGGQPSEKAGTGGLGGNVKLNTNARKGAAGGGGNIVVISRGGNTQSRSSNVTQTRDNSVTRTNTATSTRQVTQTNNGVMTQFSETTESTLNDAGRSWEMYSRLVSNAVKQMSKNIVKHLSAIDIITKLGSGSISLYGPGSTAARTPEMEIDADMSAHSPARTAGSRRTSRPRSRTRPKGSGNRGPKKSKKKKSKKKGSKPIDIEGEMRKKRAELERDARRRAYETAVSGMERIERQVGVAKMPWEGKKPPPDIAAYFNTLVPRTSASMATPMQGRYAHHAEAAERTRAGADKWWQDEIKRRFEAHWSAVEAGRSMREALAKERQRLNQQETDRKLREKGFEVERIEDEEYDVWGAGEHIITYPDGMRIRTDKRGRTVVRYANGRTYYADGTTVPSIGRGTVRTGGPNVTMKITKKKDSGGGGGGTSGGSKGRTRKGRVRSPSHSPRRRSNTRSRPRRAGTVRRGVLRNNFRLRTGFEGFVTRPTTFTVGEGNNPEYVNVSPINRRATRNRGAIEREYRRETRQVTTTRAGGGGGGGGGNNGIPAAIQQLIRILLNRPVEVKGDVVLDGYQIGKLIQKKGLRGISTIT